ncbi:MAG: Undecaprenyl-diphosphatase [Ilumatobacteraceae bacterium]|nr:Undecaprenyl-diphosphatase [Ilumatobacteraceae bacterium]
MERRIRMQTHEGAPARSRIAAVAAACVAVGIIAAVAAPADAAGAVASSSKHLLSWWKAAIMGTVEGITEFLPVSSTGHLLVTARLLDLPHTKGSEGLKAVNTYAIAIQFGAILALLGLFWKRFVEMVQGLLGKNPEGRHLLITLLIAFVPSAVLGAALDNKIEDVLFGPWPVVGAWIVGGAVIVVLARTHRIPDRREVAKAAPNAATAGLAALTYRQAAIIGAAQCLALWPGTSRSLTTILAALLLGISMSAAVEFSFLLGFATLTAATVFKLAKDGGTLVDQFGIATPMIGALFALVSAVLAVKWLITYLERHDLSLFAWYRFAIAIVTIGLIAGSVI